MDTKELIKKYQAGHQLLSNQLKNIPEKVIHYKPEDGSWSIAEVIVHIGDSEAHGFVRAKKIIAECGGRVCVYNQQIWADNLFYGEMDYLDALDMIRILRKNLVAVFNKISPEVWKNYIYHPETGKVTLLEWIQRHIDHIDVHVEQIRRIIEDQEKIQKEIYHEPLV